MMQNIFPIIIIILMGLASFFYFLNKDFGRGLYWLSGFLINIAATFLIK